MKKETRGARKLLGESILDAKNMEGERLEEKSLKLAEAVRKATPILVELNNAMDEWQIALLKWKKEKQNDAQK